MAEITGKTTMFEAFSIKGQPATAIIHRHFCTSGVYCCDNAFLTIEGAAKITGKPAETAIQELNALPNCIC